MNLNPLLLSALATIACLPARADGPADNAADKVRRIPPPGLTITASDRAELSAGVATLGQKLESLRATLTNKPALLELLPDIQIYHKAVDWALRYDEFYKTNETKVARALLAQGMERVEALADGRAPWLSATGLVVRGYRSRIDGSVQPYGLVVPPSFQPHAAHKFRLDFWFHGRGEQLTELDFIIGRHRSPGEFTPPNAFVLHLYGRYCNGSRFAGETDLFEAFEHAKKFYPIDEDRLVVRGFSLGGAACWHFASHYAGLWAAAAPGAGFSETADFLKVFQNETLKPAGYEQKLWHLYDSPDYAINYFNCPTVAYSGENDRQKQAADVMVRALARENIDLVHVIGPKTGHGYHPEAKKEINRRIDSIAEKGRNPIPDQVRFTTWTLRYNQMFWVTVEALDQHWEQARVDAAMDRSANAVKATTKNVKALSLSMPSGLCPLDSTRKVNVILDEQNLQVPAPKSDRSWTAHFVKQANQWTLANSLDSIAKGELRKKHGLQGPIDDAFMESFVMVLPSGQPLNAKVGEWTKAEQEHAIEHWRRQFRGDARVKSDTEITEADIASSNLILWGDPASNQLLAKIIGRLPIRWDAQGVHTADANYPGDRYVPVLIYPNPLNPERYVVVNSGFTFREYDYLNNARQVPKLPDFAIVDFSVPVTSRAPGGITAAGFFDEQWRLPRK